MPSTAECPTLPMPPPTRGAKRCTRRWTTWVSYRVALRTVDSVVQTARGLRWLERDYSAVQAAAYEPAPALPGFKTLVLRENGFELDALPASAFRRQ